MPSHVYRYASAARSMVGSALLEQEARQVVVVEEVDQHLLRREADAAVGRRRVRRGLVGRARPGSRCAWHHASVGLRPMREL